MKGQIIGICPAAPGTRVITALENSDGDMRPQFDSILLFGIVRDDEGDRIEPFVDSVDGIDGISEWGGHYRLLAPDETWTKEMQGEMEDFYGHRKARNVKFLTHAARRWYEWAAIFAGSIKP